MSAGIIIGGSTGGGGGGGGSDPNAVQKTGDTMTGSLTIQGASSDGLKVIDPLYGNAYQVSIVGSHLVVADTINGTSTELNVSSIMIRSPAGTTPLFAAVDSGLGHLGLYYGVVFGVNQSNTTRLYIDPTTGDLIAAGIAGPNAGKHVNLTSGKWV